MPRLIVCGICKKLERILDPPADVRRVPAKYEWDIGNGETDSHTHTMEDGTAIMVAEHDPLLEDFVERHGHDRSDIEVMNFITTFEIDMATYQSANVAEALQAELLQLTGDAYEEQNHYGEEALKCYNAHGNPDMQSKCRDFLSDEKRIGKAYRNPRNQMFLCHMCPYMQSHLATEARWQAGLYDPDKAGHVQSVINAARRRSRSRGRVKRKR